MAAQSMRIGPRRFVWGARTYVMGVINVSPESFAGDGLATVEGAVEQARRFADEGADILDVGGQSTRPGAIKSEAGFDELTVEEETARVVPVIQAINHAVPGMPVSLDTYKAQVLLNVRLERGSISMLNSIEGFRQGTELVDAAALLSREMPEFCVAIMHNQRGAKTRDVMGDVVAGLRESIATGVSAGVPRERMIVDPGFGFGWTPAENVEMLRRLGELRALGLPVLIGTSRKSTIGTVLGGALVEERLFGSAATVALAIAHGADIVRVHDVAAMKQVAVMADAIVRGWPREDPT